jgi:membrane protein
MSSPSAASESEPDREDVLGPGEVARPDLRRALEKDEGGHAGHDASTPGDIPAAGWWQVLRRVWRETSSDQMSMIAASCAFYAMLALFPAISVLISLYGLAFDPGAIEHQLIAVRDVLPAAAYDLVAQRLHDLVSKPAAALSWGLALSLAVALWSASAGTKSLMAALNVAYEEPEKRGLIRFNLTALFFTLCGVAGVALALTLIVGLPALLRLEVLGPWGAIAARVISYALLLVCVVVGLALLYRYAPSRRQASWHWITPGSLLAALLWLLASVLFSLYVSRFASYDATYGPLGAVVILLIWFYLSAFVVLLGAELNAELELQTKRDTTKGPERPMGKRGAYVADHVATADQHH